MGLKIATILLMLGAVATLAACDRGDTGKAAAPQATAAGPGAATPATKPPAAAIATIDRSHAGTPAPPVPFEWHGGEAVHVSDFKGQKVLVNLWATWCAPCVAEMPELDRLAGARRGKMVVLPISQDMEGWIAVNKFFTAGKFITIEPYVDQPGSFAETIKANGLPVSILYDEQGLEIWRVAGSPNWNELATKGIV